MSWHGRIGGRPIDGTEPLAICSMLFRSPSSRKAVKVSLAPELPLAATDSRRDVGHVRLEIVLRSLPLPCGHAAEQDDQTDLAQDQLTWLREQLN